MVGLRQWAGSNQAVSGCGGRSGHVGGVIVLLLLFYIDALVLLIGAEINSEIDYQVLKVERGARDFRSLENSPRHKQAEMLG